MKHLVFLFTLYSNFSFAQTYFENLGFLPPKLVESSGLILDSNRHLWTHNDGSDSGYIYRLNKDLTLVKKIKIINSIDKDVEEITMDDNFFYLNDMGNNRNNRNDLRIYKIKKEDAYTKDSVIAELIEFVYSDQDSLPPSKEKMNYDCEGFISYGDSLLLFSKNRGISPYSKIYILPKKSGQHTAKLIDSIYTGFWVTASAYDKESRRLALLASHIVYIFNDFKLFDKHSDFKRYTIPITQKEAIAFESDSTLLITDEKNDSTDGCMYRINIRKADKDSLSFRYFTHFSETYKKDFYFYFNDIINTDDVKISVLDSNQKNILNETLKPKIGKNNKIHFDYPIGHYKVIFEYRNIKEDYAFEVKKED